MQLINPFSRKVKNKIRIGSRNCTDKPPKHMLAGVITTACIAFVLMFATTGLPRMTEAVEADDYENEGIQLTFTGDTVFARYIEDLAEKYGYDTVFAGIEDVWSNSDYVFTNLEYTLLMEDESEYNATDKKVTLYGTTATLDAAIDAGINVFGVANNHTSDYGATAFDEEISYMYNLGLNFSGYYLSADDIPSYDDTLLAMYEEFSETKYAALECGDAKEETTAAGETTVLQEDMETGTGVETETMEANGTTIGFIAAVDSGTSETSLSSHVLKTSNTELYSYVNDSAEDNDLTVVYLHCGTEYTFSPEASQKELAHNMIDAGADIVIETHSHTLMPVEFYNGGIIFYGLGNLVMDQYQTATRDSVIVQYNESEDGGYFELVPLRINNGYTQVTSNQFYINRINRTMTKMLDKEDYYINEDGHVIIPWTTGA